MTPGRSCGPCSACCTVLGVVAIDKPDYCRCPHDQNGCAIYDERPGPCRSYRCMWLDGALPDHCRPDELGVVFSVAQSEWLGGPYVQVGELRDGAARQKVVHDFVAHLGPHYPVILMLKRTRTLLAAPDEVRQRICATLDEQGEEDG